MKVIWVRVQTLSTERYICKAKSAISNGNPKSDIFRYGRVQRVETILSQKWLVMGTPTQFDNLSRD